MAGVREGLSAVREDSCCSRSSMSLSSMENAASSSMLRGLCGDFALDAVARGADTLEEDDEDDDDDDEVVVVGAAAAAEVDEPERTKELENSRSKSSESLSPSTRGEEFILPIPARQSVDAQRTTQRSKH